MSGPRVGTPKVNRDPAKLCIRLNARGEPCGAYAIRGGTKCPRHSTKLEKQKALERYWALLPKALQATEELLGPETDAATRLRAANTVADRTLGTVVQQHAIDGSMEHTLWAGDVTRFSWVTEEGDESDVEESLKDEDRRQLEAGMDDVVEGELVPLAADELADDPWAPENMPSEDELQRRTVRKAVRAAARGS